MSLSAGGLDLGCTDLIIGGTLQTNSAPITNVRNVVIQGGGEIDAGTSAIFVGGNWTNGGNFLAGTSTVTFGDACGVNPAVITGNTTFYNLTFTTNTGKTWQLAAGSKQTVNNDLDIQGTPTNPLLLSSTVPGESAFVVVHGANDSSNFVDTNVIFLPPAAADAAPVPTLSRLGMLALLLLLSAMIAGTSFKRRGQTSPWGNEP